MRSQAKVLVALGLVGLFAVGALLPMAGASHNVRIVWPYGVDERHVPVIAGYEVVPPPLQCNQGLPFGNVLYQNDFSAGLGDVQIVPANIGERHTLNNQWHVTTFKGIGTDYSHSAGNRLYFGNDASGIFRWGPTRGFLTQGVAAITIDVPAGPTPWNLAFNTKWETEWLEGYDHMWVEAIPADGRTYILCSLNPEGRGDPTSSETISLGSCSPYSMVAVPCPVSARRLQAYGVPTQQLDASAPHWEARFVQVPPIWNGQRVTLRFTFDSADGVSNTYMGWMVDDLVVSDGFLPVPTALPVATGVAGPIV